MSDEKQDISAALKASGAPDYMVLIISKIMGAEDAIREMSAKLSAEAVEIKHRQQAVESAELALAERQAAFVQAAEDMKDFANRIYGPDSELTKINQRLDSIESAGLSRDQRHAGRLQVFETRLKGSVDRRLGVIHTELQGMRDHLDGIDERVSGLEEP